MKYAPRFISVIEEINFLFAIKSALVFRMASQIIL